MSKRILMVEDEEELCLTLGDRLRSEGYVVDVALDGSAGLEKATQLPFDLIILDIMLPFKSGLDLCTDIRRGGQNTPILLLTARSQTVDKVVGLKLGADDYVTKPFETLELMARVEALLRRTPMVSDTGHTIGPDLQQFGSIVIDTRKAKVTSAGQPVNLTAREFHLLRYFTEHAGVNLSRDELLEQVWGHMAGTLTRTVDMHVASLRQKLEPSPKRPEMIITVPGIGYRFQI
jgi:two-component system alkaline phosphatase synthesis response regulator PhoP